MSFLKNIVTLGAYGKLEDDIESLKYLASQYKYFADAYYDLGQTEEECLRIISIHRKETIKNLFMAKTIIQKVKTRISDKEFIEINDEIKKEFHSDVSLNKFDLDGYVPLDLESVGDTFLNSSNDTMRILEKKNGNISKEEALIAAASVGIATLIEGISNIASLNSEVRKKRSEILQKRASVVKAIKQIQKIYPKMNARVLRTIEITETLNQANLSFKFQYEKVINHFLYDSTWKNFWNELIKKPIPVTPEFKQDLSNLREICNSYFKLYNQKIS